MKLEALKSALKQLNEIQIKTPDGETIPAHFHLTEAGLLTRHFIDCGGTERILKSINLQLWVADDLEHRLSPMKLNGILGMAEKKLGLTNLTVEVEYQQNTIQKYHLDFDGAVFHLVPTQTDCLAKDKCGIEEAPAAEKSCTPGGGCC